MNLEATYFPLVIPGRREATSPESITTIVSMDSGPAPRGASRNDGLYLRAPERQLTSEPSRAHLDLLFREEDILAMRDDILRLPPRMRGLPAFHFHHLHLSDTARTGDAEHLAGL